MPVDTYLGKAFRVCASCGMSGKNLVEWYAAGRHGLKVPKYSGAYSQNSELRSREVANDLFGYEGLKVTVVRVMRDHVEWRLYAGRQTFLVPRKNCERNLLKSGAVGYLYREDGNVRVMSRQEG